MAPYLREFEISGRRIPTPEEQDPEIYQMRIFAPNYVVAKSRFWYHMRTLKSLKNTAGELLGVKEIPCKAPGKVKNYEVSLKVYNRRVGFINVRKEFRDTSRAAAVSQAYIDCASRNRGKFFDISVIDTKCVSASEIRNKNIQQFVQKDIKFPLKHVTPRIAKGEKFAKRRPATW
ncbi:60S ribosomal protein L20 [Perkinsela sp. CCAP 1560/4]|nr:60S ribosomal protein L20 [Perkinsela sp. CCAP 1560/4]|eukprot:KNH08332.1 60S ribosomal protein L20 [Perkinsela sp. CCAP 1560/4]